MKYQLHLLPSDQALVLSAMEEQREKLSGYDKSMFNIAYRNVCEQKEHDGMSFKYIITALIESDSDTDDLILWVEQTFKRHQKVNSPKKKGKLLNRKELLSMSKPLKGVMQLISQH